MPASSALLAQLGDRFIMLMNSRNLAAAADLYSAHATYSSVALVEQGIADGRIVGRDRIFEYLARSLDGDDNFDLAVLDQFTGVNLTVVVSSAEGRPFIDVLHTDNDGLIVEHLEVVPKSSPIGYPTSRLNQ